MNFKEFVEVEVNEIAVELCLLHRLSFYLLDTEPELIFWRVVVDKLEEGEGVERGRINVDGWNNDIEIMSFEFLLQIY